MDEVHLTRDAHDRLRQELDERIGRRPEISHWIEQGHNEARIRHIESLLRSAVVVDGAERDVVGPGTIVEIRMEGDDASTEYLVGSIEERHDTYDVLSTSSPLGQALLGARPGQVVSYSGPRRSFEVEVISVRPV